MAYRVELPVFSGPMDLLLHLVKQQEVDIHDIRIATVLDQYLAHVDVLEALDLADLGDFVVMASTLMEIKSRELLPTEEVDLEEDLSPKDDLIRRLLEYKRYRDISRRLATMMDRRGRMLEPLVGVPRALRNGESVEKTFDLGSIQVWDLTEAFARLLEETGVDREITFDVTRRTVEYYAGQILERIGERTTVDFRELFDPSRGRYELIGVFGAVLEMMKQGYLRGEQDEVTREIRIEYVGPKGATVDEILRGVDQDDLEDLEDPYDLEVPEEQEEQEVPEEPEVQDLEPGDEHDPAGQEDPDDDTTEAAGDPPAGKPPAANPPANGDGRHHRELRAGEASESP